MEGLVFAIAISANLYAPSWTVFQERMVLRATLRKLAAPDVPSLSAGLSAFPVLLPGEEVDLSIDLPKDTTLPFCPEVEALRPLNVRYQSGLFPAGPWEYPQVFSIRMA